MANGELPQYGLIFNDYPISFNKLQPIFLLRFTTLA